MIQRNLSEMRQKIHRLSNEHLGGAEVAISKCLANILWSMKNKWRYLRRLKEIISYYFLRPQEHPINKPQATQVMMSVICNTEVQERWK